MAKPFDPRKVLKHIANPLLREFFVEKRGELGDVPWGELVLDPPSSALATGKVIPGTTSMTSDWSCPDRFWRPANWPILTWTAATGRSSPPPCP